MSWEKCIRDSPCSPRACRSPHRLFIQVLRAWRLPCQRRQVHHQLWRRLHRRIRRRIHRRVCHRDRRRVRRRVRYIELTAAALATESAKCKSIIGPPPPSPPTATPSSPPSPTLCPPPSLSLAAVLDVLCEDRDGVRRATESTTELPTQSLPPRASCCALRAISCEPYVICVASWLSLRWFVVSCGCTRR